MKEWDGPARPELRAKLRAMIDASAALDQPSDEDRLRVRARLVAAMAAGAPAAGGGMPAAHGGEAVHVASGAHVGLGAMVQHSVLAMMLGAAVTGGVIWGRGAVSHHSPYVVQRGPALTAGPLQPSASDDASRPPSAAGAGYERRAATAAVELGARTAPLPPPLAAGTGRELTEKQELSARARAELSPGGDLAARSTPPSVAKTASPRHVTRAGRQRSEAAWPTDRPAPSMPPSAAEAEATRHRHRTRAHRSRNELSSNADLAARSVATPSAADGETAGRRNDARLDRPHDEPSSNADLATRAVATPSAADGETAGRRHDARLDRRRDGLKSPGDETASPTGRRELMAAFDVVARSSLPPSAAGASVPDTGLSAELTLMMAAQRALAAHQLALALSLLDQHERRFPAGALVPERIAARAVALCRSRRAREGARELQKLRERAPSSPLIGWVRTDCQSVSN